nr:myeloid leukemia factor 2-like [Lytechinus pictus]
MFGPSVFGGFDDPFFSDMQETHRRHMSSMQSMFSHPFMQPAIEGRGAMRSLQPSRNPANNPMAMSPFGMMGMNPMFADMNSMMGNMQRHMERVANDPNSHCFSSSSVMSYSNTGDGAPQYYQASSSTRQAPGGIRETRKTVRDSMVGVDKMAIGHHIGERGHVIEKSRNSRTGDQEEKQDFLNIDESDAHAFDSEWKHRTGGHRGGGRSVGASRPTMSAITDGREYRHDREQRPVRHHQDNQQSVRFDRSETTSDDAHPYHRRPTPARPKGPGQGGRQRDQRDL